jgi:single stranded DNA-binding protein
MNQIILKGVRSGAKAELKYLTNKTPVLELSVADSRKVKDEYVTQWLKVFVFGERAERLAPRIDKGTELVVIGELIKRSYKDKSGNARETVEVNATTGRIFVCEKIKNEQTDPDIDF